ncbi:4-hydroxy-tetrahydrodipicolinate synthase [Paenibacillus sp. GCM10027627]|uniref:4-hydroxy-tetrahydrodipicolinate synthase n=1 Tax=unclassified Paenibacillus TaxID=185978 RepID=UPI0036335B48
MMMNEQQVRGIFIPAITPFTEDGQLDTDSFHKYISYLARHDIQGLVINGTTGESPTVQWDEVKEMIQLTRDILTKLDKNIPIVVGTGTNDTYTTVKRTELAAELGVDAAMVVTPYYNKPTQQGIQEHFRKVAEVGLPVIVYENPARTGCRITVDTMRSIMEHDSVIGLKDSSGGIELMSALLKHETKPILCGDDAYFHAMLCQGAAGGLLASANIHPQRFIEVYERFVSGDVFGSRDLFKPLVSIIHHLYEEPASATLKWWLADQRIITNEQLRLPLVPATDSVKQRLLSVI